jgi:type III secretion protein C
VKSGAESTTVPGVATLIQALYHGGDANGASMKGGGFSPPAPAPPPSPSLAPTQSLRNSPGGPIDVPPPTSKQYEDFFARYNLLGITQTQKGRDLPQIQADPHQNAVVVRDRSERMDAHQQLVRLLDVRPRLIELQVRIAEAETAVVNVQVTGTAPALADRDRTSPVMTSDPTYRSNLSDERSRSVQVDTSTQAPFVPTEGRVRVVAEPRLTVLDNTVAEFSNLRSSTASGTAGNVEEARLQTGLRLRIVPQSMIDSDGSRRIRLSVTVHDGMVAARDNGGEDSNTSHSFSTTAIVRSGESMLLGGMSFDYLRGPAGARGSSLQSKAESTYGRSERMYVITPRFIEDGSL